MLEKYGDKIIIPVDSNVSTEISDISFNRIVKMENIKDNEIGLDIGPDTIKLFSKVLENVKTVFWNGPLGMCEYSKYAIGTKKVMEKLINLDAITILGGGDTVAAFDKLNCLDSVTYASTGGGATLKYLEGKPLPGLEFIEEVEEENEES
jgi:3-phosphoglycerate kinase